MHLNQLIETVNFQQSDFIDSEQESGIYKYVLNLVNLPAEEMVKVSDALDFCSENKPYQAVEIINYTLDDIFNMNEESRNGVFLIYHPETNNKGYSRLLEFAVQKLRSKKVTNVVSVFESLEVFEQAKLNFAAGDHGKLLYIANTDYLDYSIIFMSSLFSRRID